MPNYVVTKIIFVRNRIKRERSDTLVDDVNACNISKGISRLKVAKTHVLAFNCSYKYWILQPFQQSQNTI